VSSHCSLVCRERAAKSLLRAYSRAARTVGTRAFNTRHLIHVARTYFRRLSGTFEKRAAH
jgi:hypothetical protein